MGVRLTENEVALFCSTTEQAFGPVFSSREEGEQFLAEAPDPRGMSLESMGKLLAEIREKEERSG